MTFFANITGSLEHATAEAESEIHKAFLELESLLKRHNVTHSGSLSTPNDTKSIGFTAVAPAQPEAAADLAPVASDPAPAPEPVASETSQPEPSAQDDAAGTGTNSVS